MLPTRPPSLLPSLFFIFWFQIEHSLVNPALADKICVSMWMNVSILSSLKHYHAI